MTVKIESWDIGACSVVFWLPGGERGLGLFGFTAGSSRPEVVANVNAEGLLELCSAD